MRQRENRHVLHDGTPPNTSPLGISWSCNRADTTSLMSVMGVQLIHDGATASGTSPPHPHLSPPAKRPRHGTNTGPGKENHPHRFLVSKRFRRTSPSANGGSRSCDELPDELLLLIFRELSLPHLLKVSQVSQRWHRLAFDQALWYSVDLSSATLPAGTLGRVLASGVMVLRSPRSFLGEPGFTNDSPLLLQHMDLSHCITTPHTLLQLLRRCHRLIGLSLEGLQLSDPVLRAVGQSQDLLRLNVSSCSGFGPDALHHMLSSCSRLEEVNVSWCGFGRPHVAVTVTQVPETVTQLNISGHRQSLTDNDVQVLCQRCPRITNLDMSDSSMLTPACFPSLQQLPHLQHLGLSRCHHIPAASVGELAHITTLKSLSIFGLVNNSTLNVKDLIPQIKVNAFPLTSIARPTPAQGKTRTVWGISCRLALRTF